jgi:DnaK suppressor protein
MSYGSVDGLETLAQIAHTEDALAINRASRVVNDNDSGVCEECDNPIPLARLAAMPGARYCVQCQSLHEKAGPKFIARNPYVP